MARASAAKPGRPPDSVGEETHAKIIEAAKERFGAAGFRETSNKHVAERAGLTAATIYYYFKNKNDLFRAVHHEIQERLLTACHEGLARSGNLVDCWANSADEVMAVYKSDPHIAKFNAVFRMEALRNPDFSDTLFEDEWADYQKELVETGMKTGEIHPSREEEFLLVMAAMNFGASQIAAESSLEAYELCVRGFGNLLIGKLFNQPLD